MGFKGQGRGISGIAPVLEKETNTPEFARASFQLVQSSRRAENLPARDLTKGVTAGEVFTLRLLERFDALYQRQLIAESQALEEAELTTDLNIPYSVSRAIIEEAFPNLVAAGVFDVGITETSPTRLYFETTTGEPGHAGEVRDQAATGRAA